MALTTYLTVFTLSNYRLNSEEITTTTTTTTTTTKNKSITNSRINYKNKNYIIGPSDSLLINHTSLPEFNGIHNVEPDGTIYLKRLRSVYVKGLTIAELKSLLLREYAKYIKSPDIEINEEDEKELSPSKQSINSDSM